MPRRDDLHRILIVGSGPIVIGQACEFDYSGTQACKALRAEGYEAILINSNPATIMTDPELADRTYVEPMTRGVRRGDHPARAARRAAVDGGRTDGLNLAVALAEAGVLDKYGVELIGAKIESIKKAEDRLLFKDAMRKIGLDMPQSQLVNNVEDGLEFAERIGYPMILRPSFTMGGTGGGIAYNREEMAEILERGLDLSPVHEVLIEESVIGWKEFELEVMRDLADNAIIVCSIENFDPMGVHTGDSITVAPAQTLTDREYQMMRDAALRCLREIGVDTGGSNVQFAINPEDGRMVIVEMNPRVSRSSALASKATGFPIAKIAAKLAVGTGWTRLKNDITQGDAGVFRADDRLRGGEDTALAVREVPGRRAGAGNADEVGGRGDVDRADVQAGAGEGHPGAGDGQDAGGAKAGRESDFEPLDYAESGPAGLYSLRAASGATTVEEIHEHHGDRSLVPAADGGGGRVRSRTGEGDAGGRFLRDDAAGQARWDVRYAAGADVERPSRRRCESGGSRWA